MAGTHCARWNKLSCMQHMAAACPRPQVRCSVTRRREDEGCPVCLPPAGHAGCCRCRRQADPCHHQRQGCAARQVSSVLARQDMDRRLMQHPSMDAGGPPPTTQLATDASQSASQQPIPASDTAIIPCPLFSRFRYMAQLRNADKPTRPHCDGALIHPRVILTAGHVSRRSALIGLVLSSTHSHATPVWLHVRPACVT